MPLVGLVYFGLVLFDILYLSIDPQAVQDMDEKFYSTLMTRHRKENIPEQELDRLVEDHLDEVERFRARLKGMIDKKRKEREEMKRQSRQVRMMVEAILGPMKGAIPTPDTRQNFSSDTRHCSQGIYVIAWKSVSCLRFNMKDSNYHIPVMPNGAQF